MSFESGVAEDDLSSMLHRVKIRPNEVHTFPASELSFGRTTLPVSLLYHQFHVARAQHRPSLAIDVNDRRQIAGTFRIACGHGRTQCYRVYIPLTDLEQPTFLQLAQSYTLTIRTRGELKILRLGPAVSRTESTWILCSEVESALGASTGPIRLYQENAEFEVARCNTMRFTIRRTSTGDSDFRRIMDQFEQLNMAWEVDNVPQMKIHPLSPLDYKLLWKLFYQSVPLPFNSQYLLESTVSTGRIDETQMQEVQGTLSSLSSPMAARTIMDQIARQSGTLPDPCAFIRTLHDRGSWRDSVHDDIPEHCVKLNKVIITSTSLIILPPMTEMSNRILRQYSTHGDRFLRVQFLDDMNRGKLYSCSGFNDNIYARIMRTLVHGIHVGGRLFKFLAFGNSQLRDHGGFFFSDCKGFSDCGNENCQGLSGKMIREAVGDVSEIMIVARQAARISQAFSTTRPLRRNKGYLNILRIPDQFGGVNGQYCFTDGVGMISAELVQEIVREFKHIGHSPSAVQFRLGGAKGVLTVMDTQATQRQYKELSLNARSILLRDSQVKFHSDHESLEIVRTSVYGSAYLNRQFITVLWSLRVPTEVFLTLQTDMVRELDECMLDEDVALRCLRRHVDEVGSSLILRDLVSFGFFRRGDPFVNQVLQLFRTWSLKQLKEKARISVPKGCYLMGVVDELGVLRGHHESMYDQDDSDLSAMDLPEIFVQISNNTDGKEGLRILEGICIVGRAPALHPGDFRLVRAVDKPGLRHLIDVMVFPRTGDQDVPSMCGGGDLDGDDYTIFWDQRLIPPKGYRYCRCMNYTGPKPTPAAVITLQDVFKFIVDFMQNDVLGSIAIAHLAFSHDPQGTQNGRPKQPDLRAFSDECLKLAELHSMAVDFVKTGIPAEKPRSLLRRSFPDFMEKPKTHSFTSDTPLSRLYRALKTSTSSFTSKIIYDQSLCNVPMMMDHLDSAASLKKEYDRRLRQLMQEYGIASESEVVTGFILGYDSQYASSRQHKVRDHIAQKYRAIKNMMRERITQMTCKDAAGVPLDPHLTARTKEAFVAAMYDVTFSERLSAEESFISFPWIEHEVLGRLSRRL